MNRTIKFRGKRLDNGGWVYGELCTPRLFDSKRGYFGEDVPCIFCDEGNVPIIPESVGQFTGLLDKNGKEIYEGDIISLRDYIAEVRWNSNLSAFCIRFSFESELGIKPLGSWIDRRRRCNVIGNIHDNSELLNEK